MNYPSKEKIGKNTFLQKWCGTRLDSTEKKKATNLNIRLRNLPKVKLSKISIKIKICWRGCCEGDDTN